MGREGCLFRPFCHCPWRWPGRPSLSTVWVANNGCPSENLEALPARLVFPVRVLRGPPLFSRFVVCWLSWLCSSAELCSHRACCPSSTTCTTTHERVCVPRFNVPALQVETDREGGGWAATAASQFCDTAAPSRAACGVLTSRRLGIKTRSLVRRAARCRWPTTAANRGVPSISLTQHPQRQLPVIHVSGSVQS